MPRGREIKNYDTERIEDPSHFASGEVLVLLPDGRRVKKPAYSWVPISHLPEEQQEEIKREDPRADPRVDYAVLGVPEENVPLLEEGLAVGSGGGPARRVQATRRLKGKERAAAIRRADARAAQEAKKEAGLAKKRKTKEYKERLKRLESARTEQAKERDRHNAEQVKGITRSVREAASALKNDARQVESRAKSLKTSTGVSNMVEREKAAFSERVRKLRNQVDLAGRTAEKMHPSRQAAMLKLVSSAERAVSQAVGQFGSSAEKSLARASRLAKQEEKAREQAEAKARAAHASKVQREKRKKRK